ncbi:hypothetical protein [Aeromonas veronii]|uniref:hypothetical protein n=1 Tax=Aeromonas veronii TaxID=654 RepID=UPI0031FCCB54
MPETAEKMYVLVAEQERSIKELIAKEQVSNDDANQISFHIGFLFGVSVALSKVEIVGMTVNDKEQIIAAIGYATGSIKKEAEETLARCKKGDMRTTYSLYH